MRKSKQVYQAYEAPFPAKPLADRPEVRLALRRFRGMRGPILFATWDGSRSSIGSWAKDRNDA